jgi:hypothetical protein
VSKSIGPIRLKNALGTTSSDFVNASLLQIQSALSFALGKDFRAFDESALAMIEAAAPKDEIEAALAVQMACTHTAGGLRRSGRQQPA